MNSILPRLNLKQSPWDAKRKTKYKTCPFEQIPLYFPGKRTPSTPSAEMFAFIWSGRFLLAGRDIMSIFSPLWKSSQSFPMEYPFYWLSSG